MQLHKLLRLFLQGLLPKRELGLFVLLLAFFANESQSFEAKLLLLFRRFGRSKERFLADVPENFSAYVTKELWLRTAKFFLETLVGSFHFLDKLII